MINDNAFGNRAYRASANAQPQLPQLQLISFFWRFFACVCVFSFLSFLRFHRAILQHVSQWFIDRIMQLSWIVTNTLNMPSIYISLSVSCRADWRIDGATERNSIASRQIKSVGKFARLKIANKFPRSHKSIRNNCLAAINDLCASFNAHTVRTRSTVISLVRVVSCVRSTIPFKSIESSRTHRKCCTGITRRYGYVNAAAYEMYDWNRRHLFSHAHRFL